MAKVQVSFRNKPRGEFYQSVNTYRPYSHRLFVMSSWSSRSGQLYLYHSLDSLLAKSSDYLALSSVILPVEET